MMNSKTIKNMVLAIATIIAALVIAWLTYPFLQFWWMYRQKKTYTVSLGQTVPFSSATVIPGDAWGNVLPSGATISVDMVQTVGAIVGEDLLKATIEKMSNAENLRDLDSPGYPVVLKYAKVSFNIVDNDDANMRDLRISAIWKIEGTVTANNLIHDEVFKVGWIKAIYDEVLTKGNMRVDVYNLHS